MTTKKFQVVVSETGAKEVKRSVEQIGAAAKETKNSVEQLKRATNMSDAASQLAGLESKAAQLKQELKNVENQGKSLNGAFGALKGILAAVVTSATLNSLIGLADAYTNVLNKLKLVTTGQENLAAVNERVYKVSQDTRQGYTETAELYARIARSSKDLGKSQEDILTVTKAVNQSLTISGASSQEAATSIVQLGQALGSGSLRGDELRSVLENNTRLARAIADGMGVSFSKLRQMGADGELTSKAVFEAIQKQASKLNDEFSRMAPTVGQSFTVLQNAATKFIGDFDQANGVSRRLAQGLIFLGDNFNTVARLAMAAGVTMLVAFGPQLIGYLGAAARAMGAFMLVLQANPIIAITTALVGLGAILVALKPSADELANRVGSSINKMKNDTEQLPVSAVNAGNDYKVGLEAVANAWDSNYAELVSIQEKMKSHTALTTDELVTLWNSGAISMDDRWRIALEGMFNNWGQFWKMTVAKMMEASNAIDSIAARIQASIANALGNLPGAAGNYFKGRAAAFGAEATAYSILQSGEKRKADTALTNIFNKSQGTLGLKAPGGLNPATKATPGSEDDDKKKKKGVDRAEELRKINANLDQQIKLLGVEKEKREALQQMYQIESSLRDKGITLTQKEKKQIWDKIQLIDQLKKAEEKKEIITNKNDSLNQEIALLKVSKTERESLQQMLQIEQQLKQKGISLSAQEKKQLEDKIKLVETLKRNDIKQTNVKEQTEDINNQILVLRAEAKERGILSGLYQFESQMKRQGIEVTQQDLEQRRELLTHLRDEEILSQNKTALLQMLVGPQEEYNNKLIALKQLLAEGKINLDQFNLGLWNLQTQLNNSSTTFGAGFQEGLKGLIKTSKDFGTDVADTIGNAFSSLEDQFVSFVTTGKADFKGMINSMLADVARLVIRYLVIQPILKSLGGAFGIPGLGGGGGFADGGVFEQGVHVSPYASGGVVSSPTIFPMAKGSVGLMGEAGPEAIMPLRRTSSGRLGVEMANKNVGTSNVFSPVISVNVEGGSSGDKTKDREFGEEIGTRIQRVVEIQMAEFIQKQKRPGGMLA